MRETNFILLICSSQWTSQLCLSMSQILTKMEYFIGLDQMLGTVCVFSCVFITVELGYWAHAPYYFWWQGFMHLIIYKRVWIPRTGEILSLAQESASMHNRNIKNERQWLAICRYRLFSLKKKTALSLYLCVKPFLTCLRRFHMGTLMCIECASDPDWLRSHECALTWCASDAHRVRIRLNPPPEVVWMRNQTGLYYYSWFMQGYAYHKIVGSVGFTCWLGLWHVFMALFRSALAATLGKK